MAAIAVKAAIAQNRLMRVASLPLQLIGLLPTTLPDILARRPAG